MQDRKKDTDVYNGLLDSEGEGACFPAARVVMNIDDASLICHCSLSAMQPFPNRPWMGTNLWPGGWGPLLYALYLKAYNSE